MYVCMHLFLCATFTSVFSSAFCMCKSQNQGSVFQFPAHSISTTVYRYGSPSQPLISVLENCPKRIPFLVGCHQTHDSAICCLMPLNASLMPPNLLSEVHPDRSPDHGTRNMPRIAHVGVTRVEAHNILAQPERSEEGRGDGDDEPKQDCACGKLRKRSSESHRGGQRRQNNCASVLAWSTNFDTIASLRFGVWGLGWWAE
jgi:hypothetical protein